ncbi:MAG: hypothetical protein RL291_1243 [Pseudomonadota bacterium]|jgi:hypothetical protein
MTAIDYTYSEQSRRPATLGALAVSIAMAAVGVAYGAPWYFLAPVAVGGLMALALIVVNRKSGMALAGDQLTLFAGSWSQVVPTAKIQAVEVTEWSEGAPWLKLVLSGAPPVDIPGYCFGSAKHLVEALASRNIAVLKN